MLSWFIFVLLAFFGAICGLAHWCFIFTTIGKLLAKKADVSGYSLVLPYIGPWLLVLAAFAYPPGGLSDYWWLAFIIEPQYLIFFGFYLIQKFGADNNTSG